MDITILTPTYNRGENLKKLYFSLINQSNHNFIWMIIDDGSKDKTQEIVRNFIKDNIIKIEYFIKENGGKHTALNVGISKIDTELIFIVDSDDWLEENAIEKIYKYHSKYKLKKEICGYSFLRKYSNGIINGKILDKNEIIDDYINIRINGNDTNSDKAEVWKTQYLRNYHFPVFKGEKFLGEDVIWVQLAIEFKMVFLNEIIYISDYLEDGLTKNRRVNNLKSPKGCCYRSKLIIDISKTKNINVVFLIKNIIQYIVYGKFSKSSFKALYNECSKKISFLFLYPISIMIYNKWKREYII